MKKSLIWTVCLLLSFLCVGCSQPQDYAQAEEPVKNYLLALQVGDYEKAAAQEAPDCGGKHNVLEKVDQMNAILDQMDMGKAFDAQGRKFLSNITKLAFRSVEIAGTRKTSSGYQVTAQVTGVDVQKLDFSALMKESEADIQDQVDAFAKENAKEKDADKLQGGLGKILFDKVYEIAHQSPEATYKLVFTVQDVDGTYLITEIN